MNNDRRRQNARQKANGKLPGELCHKSSGSRIKVLGVLDVSERGMSIFSAEAVAKGSILTLSPPQKTPIELEVIYCNFETGSGEPRYRVGLFARRETISLRNICKKYVSNITQNEAKSSA